jgi:hypothetical protein
MTGLDRFLGQLGGMAVTAVIVACAEWPIEIAAGVGVLAGAATVFILTNLILRDRV